jgi:serine/threonine protein kinase
MKPNNILYGKRGEVKVIDYGLAWIRGEKKERFQGTPEYMAPETVNSKTINEQTEVYNFGASMYRMVTGKPAANLLALRGDTMRVSEKTWRGLFKPVTQINPATPPALADLIHKCLEFHPANRIERMSDVRDAMRQIAADLGEGVSDASDAGL